MAHGEESGDDRLVPALTGDGTPLITGALEGLAMTLWGERNLGWGVG
jgi:hypothetical protein